jgi:hypothetical protein
MPIMLIQFKGLVGILYIYIIVIEHNTVLTNILYLRIFHVEISLYLFWKL